MYERGTYLENFQVSALEAAEDAWDHCGRWSIQQNMLCTGKQSQI
jgi:hypothetical protein